MEYCVLKKFISLDDSITIFQSIFFVFKLTIYSTHDEVWYISLNLIIFHPIQVFKEFFFSTKYYIETEWSLSFCNLHSLWWNSRKNEIKSYNTNTCMTTADSLITCLQYVTYTIYIVSYMHFSHKTRLYASFVAHTKK